MSTCVMGETVKRRRWRLSRRSAADATRAGRVTVSVQLSSLLTAWAWPNGVDSVEWPTVDLALSTRTRFVTRVTRVPDAIHAATRGRAPTPQRIHPDWSRPRARWSRGSGGGTCARGWVGSVAVARTARCESTETAPTRERVPDEPRDGDSAVTVVATAAIQCTRTWPCLGHPVVPDSGGHGRGPERSECCPQHST